MDLKPTLNLRRPHLEVLTLVTPAKTLLQIRHVLSLQVNMVWGSSHSPQYSKFSIFLLRLISGVCPSLNVPGARRFPRSAGSVFFPRAGSRPPVRPCPLVRIGGFLHGPVELGSIRHCRLLAGAPRQDVVFMAIVRARSLGRGELSPCLGSRDQAEGGLGFHVQAPPTALSTLFLRTCGVRRLVCHFAWSCGASRDRRHSQPSSGRRSWASGGRVEWRSPRRRRRAARAQRTLRMWV